MTLCKRILDPGYEAALDLAIGVLIDEYLDDIEKLARGARFESTRMAADLPREHLGRYDHRFARDFLTCLVTVAWKLLAPDAHLPACVGEELALRAILEEVRRVVESGGEKADFGELVDPGHDVPFEEWFTPFEGEYVHPYLV